MDFALYTVLGLSLLSWTSTFLRLRLPYFALAYHPTRFATFLRACYAQPGANTPHNHNVKGGAGSVISDSALSECSDHGLLDLDASLLDHLGAPEDVPGPAEALWEGWVWKQRRRGGAKGARPWHRRWLSLTQDHVTPPPP